MNWWDIEGLVKFQTPTSIMISGPSNSGKTVFLSNLLKNAAGMFVEPPCEILYCYGSVWQPIFSKMQHDIDNITFYEGLPGQQHLLEVAKNKKHFICVLEDLMLESSNNSFVETIFTKESHHLNMTVIITIQNIFQKGKVMRTLSLNTHYFVIFKNYRDQQQIQTLGRQMFGKQVKFFLDAYEKATKSPFSYLLVDINVHSKKIYQLRTDILPGQNTVIFLNKDETYTI